jgi:hypothetical protein
MESQSRSNSGQSCGKGSKQLCLPNMKRTFRELRKSGVR